MVGPGATGRCPHPRRPPHRQLKPRGSAFDCSRPKQSSPHLPGLLCWNKAHQFCQRLPVVTWFNQTIVCLQELPPASIIYASPLLCFPHFPVTFIHFHYISEPQQRERKPSPQPLSWRTSRPPTAAILALRGLGLPAPRGVGSCAVGAGGPVHVPFSPRSSVHSQLVPTSWPSSRSLPSDLWDGWPGDREGGTSQAQSPKADIFSTLKGQHGSS